MAFTYVWKQVFEKMPPKKFLNAQNKRYLDMVCLLRCSLIFKRTTTSNNPSLLLTFKPIMNLRHTYVSFATKKNQEKPNYLQKDLIPLNKYKTRTIDIIKNLIKMYLINLLWMKWLRMMRLIDTCRFPFLWNHFISEVISAAIKFQSVFSKKKNFSKKKKQIKI